MKMCTSPIQAPMGKYLMMHALYLEYKAYHLK